MFKLRLASTKQEIKMFEEMREKVFNPDSKEFHYSFEEAIESGEMIALLCMDDKKPVGGILLRLSGKNIKIARLFVIPNEQGKGAGKLMIDYVENKQSFFEDYYGCPIKGIIIEPLQSSVEYYYSKGYDYSGFQMYKRYSNK